MGLSHNNAISMKYDIKKRNPDIVELKREYKRRKQTTESPERVYFCWFLSLKLILEMENLGLGKTIIGKYKIDRDFYKEWNLDSLLHLSFYKWWEMHQTLFEIPIFRYQIDDWKNKKKEVYKWINKTELIRRSNMSFLTDRAPLWPQVGKPRGPAQERFYKEDFCQLFEPEFKEFLKEILALEKSKKEDLVGGDSKKNAEIINGILKGDILGAKKNIVLLNSASALYINSKIKDIKTGLEIVNETIESGKALKKLDDLIELSNS